MTAIPATARSVAVRSIGASSARKTAGPAASSPQASVSPMASAPSAPSRVVRFHSTYRVSPVTVKPIRALRRVGWASETAVVSSMTQCAAKGRTTRGRASNWDRRSP